MNKRIKQKVAKRIINKIGTENPLTDFERKYFIKFFWKPLSKDLFRIGEQLKAEAELQTQAMEEHVNKLSAAEVEWFSRADYAESSDMTAHSVVENKIEENFQIAINAMNKFGTQINPEPSVAAVEEPSNWNKLKGKVKGWFGK